ncbi:MAG: hypothetical protein IK128_06115 [Clostridiales bacterium]|nr:hypothetical protein [Clostridiales bacterium]
MSMNTTIRKVILYAVYILLFASLQVSFPDAISFRGQIADLMFVFVVLTGYFFGFADGTIIGLLTGIVRDCFSSPAVIGLDGKVQVTVGIGALVLFLAGAYGSSFFTKKLHRSIPFAFLSVASATLIYKVIGHIVAFVWIKVLGNGMYSIGIKEVLIDSILPQLLLNAVATLPLLLLLRFLGPYKLGSVTDKKDDVIESYGENSWFRI